MRNLCATRQLNYENARTSSMSSQVEETSSSNVGGTPMYHVEGTPLSTSEGGGTPMYHVEGTPSSTSEGGVTPMCHVEGTPLYHFEGTPLSTSEGVATTSSHVDDTQDGTQFTHNVSDAPRIIYRKPKYLIDIDTNILQAMPDKIPKRTCQRNANRIWRSFFENLNMTGRCQLFVEMMRNLKFRPIMKILGLRTMDESSEKSIVKNLMTAYESVGSTSRTKDSNVTRRVLTSTIVSNQMKKSRLIRKTSKTLKISRKSLMRALRRRKRVEDPNSNELWAFSGRLPRKDKAIVEALKSLIEEFWKNNTRVSPNQRDVVRRRIGSRIRVPHPKHFLDSTQTQFFAKFMHMYPQIKISQRYFEMCKPFYVKINHTCTTCCCRVHIEFSNHFEVYRNICVALHSNNVLQDCNINVPPRSSRELISTILCERVDGQQFYKLSCLNGTCIDCGGLRRLPICQHMESTHAIGNEIVEFGKYKTMTYNLKDGKEAKRCDLVIEKIPVYQFMDIFCKKIIYEYARHTHRARWLDMQFKLCKDTFPLETIVSVVDFAENYTLQPQNEVQAKYYSSQQVAIFVHIAFMHAPDSTEQNRKILREYHFYISDDRSHSTEFVHGCFQLFYGHLANRGIKYHRHIIWSDNCASQFKNSRMFYWLCRMHKITGIQYMWNFTEAGHGKGEHDGAGACIKRALAREELKYTEKATLSDARCIVQWCNATMGPGNEGESMVRRFFWFMDETNIAPYEDCCTLTGSSELHSFRSCNAGSWSIHTRHMACFCSSCVDEDWDGCESKEWVDEWYTHSLSPLASYHPHESLQLTKMESSIDFDRLSDLVQPGHVFAVIAPEDNEEGTDYYLCHCVEAKKKLDHSVIDGEELEYPIGAVVVTGTWLRRYAMKNPRLWLFEDWETHRKILHYSNLVVASNVHLIRYGGRPQNKTLWKVLESDHEAILETIKGRADPIGTLD